ncbi:MAG TPA: hypothetical protein VGO11_19440 [Chthoniobacteraceae bacterium]|nr:hypothetical protein [Chthoniobacteraceae bacterium]
MSTDFVYIKFHHDGVDAKLSEPGLMKGTSAKGAYELAKQIVAEHSARLGRPSPINATLLSAQILAHALAYFHCDYAAKQAGTMGGAMLGQAAGSSLGGLGGAIGSGVGAREGSRLGKILATEKCPAIRRHANPVNVSWIELNVWSSKGLGRD